MKLFYLFRNWIRGLFTPEYEEPFGWSPEDFNKARRWARNQPHPKFPDHPKMSLWDHVSNSYVDSEYKLFVINQKRVEKIKKRQKKSKSFDITADDIYRDLMK